MLTKYTPCKFKCKFYGRKCRSNQKWNDNKCRCECKNPKEHHVCKKGYTWNPAVCSLKNCEYVASSIEDSVITFGEIVNVAKSVSTNVPTNLISTVSHFHIRKVRFKIDGYILYTILLVIILLFIIAIIFYHYAKLKNVLSC